MTSLAELEQTPQVVAYKAELARLEKERLEAEAEAEAEEARLEKLFQPAKMIADRIHNYMLDSLWFYADTPDMTDKKLEIMALKYESSFEDAEEELRGR